MTRVDCDLAIIGSGFGGTLLALVARRLGFTVALLERGTHPRFAIGESSTPLADFMLAALAREYGLDWLGPLAKYGSWKAAYPELPCGLKRGFSFFHHRPGQAFTPRADNANALLVAASATNALADTHWFRADFDAHLVARALEAGVVYLDRLRVESLRPQGSGWRLLGVRPDGAVAIDTRFVVDATGDGQLLGRELCLPAMPDRALRTRSRALYGHFTGVLPWQALLQEDGSSTRDHPFPCDAAALHHVLAGGWMWVLRFDHGVTSAGVSLDPQAHPIRPGEDPAAEWGRLLRTYPSLGRQFAGARPVRPLIRTDRLQRRWAQAAGETWALLPHAAGFLDPWLSPGIAQTLFAVHRLGAILSDDWRSNRRAKRLAAYGQAVLEELAWMDEITAACFACFDRFDRFTVLATVTMVYFTAAIWCEERHRAGLARRGDHFLLADDPAYRQIAAGVFRQAPSVPSDGAEAFAAAVQGAIAPYNVAGLCDPAKRNLYPFVSTTGLAV